MEGGRRELGRDLLKRLLVVVLSNISFECLFARFDSLLNLLRFNEPANEYERVLEILAMQWTHFNLFSRVLKVDFSIHLLSLYMVCGGVMRLAYYRWLRKYTRVLLFMLWEWLAEFWEFLATVSLVSWFLIAMLSLAGTGLILLKME